jgi:hypothetical protein
MRCATASKLQQPPPRYTTTTNINNNSNKYAPVGIGNGGNGNDADHDNNTFLYEQPTLQYSAVILLENRADDVSTLGDPVGLGPCNAASSHQLGRDERTASFGENDYDFAKHTSSLLGADFTNSTSCAWAGLSRTTTRNLYNRTS